MNKLFMVIMAAMLCACAPDFTEPWEVKIPRLMAGRVEIEGDPSQARSRPRPGETFDIRLFMSTPRAPNKPLSERYDAKLELCVGILRSNGELACGVVPGQPASITFPSAPEVVSIDELRFRGLVVPKELEDLNLPPPFDAIDRIAVFGAVCVDGKAERVQGKEVNRDPLNELFRCTNNDDAEFQDPLIFTLSVFLDRGLLGDDNKHPSFACEAAETSNDACRAGVEVEGEQTVPGSFVLALPKAPGDSERKLVPWEPLPSSDDLPWTNCRERGLPIVKLGEEPYLIRVRFDARDRESFEYETERYGKTEVVKAREELIVSHALTELGGELERFFSVIEADVPDEKAELEVEYTPPALESRAAKGLARGGRLVRFYFTVRDERGGVDYTTRELCLVP